ncbi:cytochrome b [Sphingomonas sp. Leaf4]|uniref:cytochrome b n=1 Tax=Sphingomonas sp. Leaf4 TaxID=2876553 RepID=UPI001E451A7E|nr:cytochrome b [Sphingomonas sp. Leaf4]
MVRAVPGARYSRVAIAFHWVIAFLVVVNLWIGLIGGSMGLHKSIGLTVLVLTIGRIGWRIANPPPPLPVSTSAWERAAAHLTHAIFYLFLIVLPMSGWAMASGTTRRPLEWFGLFAVPYLPISPAAAGAGHEVHEIVGITMAVLVALHVGAALRHHFVLRDAVLARMLPGVR